LKLLHNLLIVGHNINSKAQYCILKCAIAVVDVLEAKKLWNGKCAYACCFLYANTIIKYL